MYQQRSGGDFASVVMWLFRLSIIAIFFVMFGRLYQLQIMQNQKWNTESRGNQFKSIELRPLRGIIYDRAGLILARNRPSFEVALVPEFIPEDNTETKEVDEEVVALTEILQLMQADTRPDITVRIQDLMLRRLGYADYQSQVISAGLQIPLIEVISKIETRIDPQSGLSNVITETVFIPDTSVPLPLNGLVALVKQLITLRRLGGSSIPETILDLVDRPMALSLIEEAYRIPSVRVSSVPVREYKYEDLFSHSLGFMGPIPASQVDDYELRGYRNKSERVGLTGLEQSYQDILRGRPGSVNNEVDILGRVVRPAGAPIEPDPGQNLWLGIDRRLQGIMHDTLQAKVDELGKKWGVAIAMNPETGLVLGLVSLPSFNNNIFSEGIGKEYFALAKDERKPLINYAIGGTYPPGSTFKMVPATAALATGLLTPDQVHRDDGPLFLPNKFDPSVGQTFVSWNHKLGVNYGPLNVEQALALSNDIFFYYIGGGYPPSQLPGLGDQAMEEWSALFGYGPATGIDLPGEVDVTLPDDQWKRQIWAESWTTGDSYNLSIGQGFMLATPLQVLVSSAAVANGGKVMQPQIVYQITDAKGGLQRDFAPKMIRQLPVAPELIEVVRHGMLRTVEEGTAIQGQIPGLPYGAKTGTAEYCDPDPAKKGTPDPCRRDDKNNLPTHAWFVAFAPYEKPEIAIVVFVYDGGEGSSAAMPVAQTVLKYYFSEISPRPLN